MVTDDDRAYLIRTFDVLREVLHKILPDAAEVADTHFDEYSMDAHEYRAGRAHLARAHARRILLEEMSRTDCGLWRVANPGNNGRLWLSHQGLRLRLLRPLPNAAAPPPGRNPSRVAFYTNTHATLFGVSGSNLIGLWDIDDAGDAQIRVIRPMGRWRYGNHEKVDIDFPLLKATSLSELEFQPRDDLGIELPYETEEERGQEEEAAGDESDG